MPAMILRRDIQVGVEKAWHGLTHVVPKITKENCGICYPMALQQMQLPSGIKTPHYVVVSLDDGLPIGSPVSKKYAIITHEEIWDAVDRALDQTDHEIVSVGTIFNRERGFISIKLSDAFIAANRKTDATLNVTWGHGGKQVLSARTGFTQIVCYNTFQLALREKGEFNFHTKHIGDATLKLEDMQDAIEAYLFSVETFREAMDEFYTTDISQEDARKFFAGFIVENPLLSPSTHAVNQYKELHRLFNTGAGNTGKNMADVFSATTDYFTHQSAGGIKHAQRQFESSEFGQSLDRKVEVFKLLYGAKVNGLGDFEDCLKRGTVVLERAV